MILCFSFFVFSPIGCMRKRDNLDIDDSEDIGDDYLLKKKLNEDVDF